MSKMFIANPTQQVRIINYRLPEVAKLMTQVIDMGRQVQVNGKPDLSQLDIDAVCEHLCKYGMINVNDLNRAPRAVIPLIFSLDKPITYDVIRRVLDHNKGIQIDNGKEARLKAALAANTVIESRATMVDAEVPMSEISVEEENQGSFAGEAPAIAEGFRIQKQPGDQTLKPRKGKRSN